MNRASDGWETIWTPGLPKYSGANLAAMIQKRIGIPCMMANNAGLAAMAALRSGGQRR